MQEEHTKCFDLWMKELYNQCCIIILLYCQYMVNTLKTLSVLNIMLTVCLISHTFSYVSNTCLNYVCENICLTHEEHPILCSTCCNFSCVHIVCFMNIIIIMTNACVNERCHVVTVVNHKMNCSLINSLIFSNGHIWVFILRMV